MQEQLTAIEKCHYPAGAFIFRQGDQGQCAFVVESGSVRILKTVEGDILTLATLKAGGIFGEMAVIDPGERMASAQAAEECLLLKVPRGAFQERLETVDPFLRGVIKILIRNLRNVHKTYQTRPRSVQDSLAMMAVEVEGMKSYVHKVGPEEFPVETLEQLKALTAVVQDVQAMFRDHQDRRGSALPDTEVGEG